jgi:hypothetical protein
VILSIYLSESVDPLQFKNDESMTVSNFCYPLCGLNISKSSSCNSSQALVGSLTLNEEGMLSNRKKAKVFSSLHPYMFILH